MVFHLQRHFHNDSSKVCFGRFQAVFNDEQEASLVHYLKHMSNLTRKDLGESVCWGQNIQQPFSQARARDEWIKSLLKRHKDLTLRTPEPTSNAEQNDSTKTKLTKFFNLLMEAYPEGASNI